MRKMHQAILVVMEMLVTNLCNLAHEASAMLSKMATVNVVPAVVSHTTNRLPVVMVALVLPLDVAEAVEGSASLFRKAAATVTTAASHTRLNRSTPH